MKISIQTTNGLVTITKLPESRQVLADKLADAMKNSNVLRLATNSEVVINGRYIVHALIEEDPPEPSPNSN